MKFNKLFILLSAFAFIGPVQADTFKPSNYCTKPTKPYKFTSEWQITQYYNDVERYQRCISEFVESQEKAIQNHQKAIQEAIDEWNRFVRYEGN
ncbi:MAG: hypothetical protein QMB80_10540 [Acinetobacter towneri]